MGTRARIGIVNQDGTVTSICLGSDGYPESVAQGWPAPGHGAGEILQEDYATEDRVRTLMEKGDTEDLRKDGDGDGDGDVYGEAITHPADAWPATGQEHEYRFNVGFGGGGVWWYRKVPGLWKSLADVLPAASGPDRPAGPEEPVDPKTPTWSTESAIHGGSTERRLQRAGWEPFAAWPDGYGRVHLMYRRLR